MKNSIDLLDASSAQALLQNEQIFIDQEMTHYVFMLTKNPHNRKIILKPANGELEILPDKTFLDVMVLTPLTYSFEAYELRKLQEIAYPSARQAT